MNIQSRTDSALFFREVSKNKLKKIIQIVDQDPLSLVKEVEKGTFNPIRKKAREILFDLGNKTKEKNKPFFRRAIEILDERV